MTIPPEPITCGHTESRRLAKLIDDATDDLLTMVDDRDQEMSELRRKVNALDHASAAAIEERDNLRAKVASLESQLAERTAAVGGEWIYPPFGELPEDGAVVEYDAPEYRGGLTRCRHPHAGPIAGWGMESILRWRYPPGLPQAPSPSVPDGKRFERCMAVKVEGWDLPTDGVFEEQHFATAPGYTCRKVMILLPDEKPEPPKELDVAEFRKWAGDYRMPPGAVQSINDAADEIERLRKVSF